MANDRNRPAAPTALAGMPDLAALTAHFAKHDISTIGLHVHYNSPGPGAHAYAEGTHIHLAPGKAHTLAHEVWHAVQQRDGQVAPGVRSHIGLNKDPHARAVDCALRAIATPK